MTAIPHDGWKSRKVILGAGAFVLMLGVSTAALFYGKATFDQWASFLKWITPAVLLPTFGALGLDKFAQAKAAK